MREGVPVDFRDMVPKDSEEPASMVTASLSPDDQSDKVENLYSTPPFMSTNCKSYKMFHFEHMSISSC